jgi:membrane-associated phospholipid phosphatase
MAVRTGRAGMDAASPLWWLPLTVTGVLADRGSRARWLCVPGLIALAASVSTTGKLATRRPRPSRGRGSPPIGRLGLASSFPSTHAACAFAVAGWMRRSRHRGWLHLLAATVGYMRVRRRAHHLGDVLAGGALGYAIGGSADWSWSSLRSTAIRAKRRFRSAGFPRRRIPPVGTRAERDRSLARNFRV